MSDDPFIGAVQSWLAVGALGAAIFWATEDLRGKGWRFGKSALVALMLAGPFGLIASFLNLFPPPK